MEKMNGNEIGVKQEIENGKRMHGGMNGNE